jgi:hypothetical protein
MALTPGIDHNRRQEMGFDVHSEILHPTRAKQSERTACVEGNVRARIPVVHTGARDMPRINENNDLKAALIDKED